ncbi:MAG: hypothetical protein ACRD2S_05270 [Terriglobales bacterium]
MTLALDAATVVPKKRKGMLPILIVLFLGSYGLMCTLVVEQGRTIQSQRDLIRDLFNDSSQLNAMKLKELLRERAMVDGAAKVGAHTTAPRLRVSPRDGIRNKNAARAQMPALQKPPKPAADTADVRRIPLTI